MFCHTDYVEDIEGDLLERFEKKPSKWRFTLEILKLLRPSLIKPAYDRKFDTYDMFRHHLIIAYRNLKRQKSAGFINVGGLVLGLKDWALGIE
ncbi:MAG: hypothetical protein AAFY41_01825 [Bacteroidota bacterium]